MIATLVMGLGACANMTPPGAAFAGRYHDAIDIRGRLSLRYEQDGKPAAMHGGFEWTQMPQHATLTLFSPLGQTLAVVDITPTLATLTQANQAPRMAANVDALIADTLGWPLPVSGLRDWLQGYVPDADGRRIAVTPARDAITTPDGWRLRYVSWQDEAPPRPMRIDLERSTVPAGSVAVRIVIDTWQAH